jgi:hypothetical protein
MVRGRLLARIKQDSLPLFTESEQFYLTLIILSCTIVVLLTRRIKCQIAYSQQNKQQN